MTDVLILIYVLVETEFINIIIHTVSQRIYCYSGQHKSQNLYTSCLVHCLIQMRKMHYKYHYSYQSVIQNHNSGWYEEGFS